jgi:hypothetical protein
MPSAFRAGSVGREDVGPAVHEEVEAIRHHSGGCFETKPPHLLLRETRWPPQVHSDWKYNEKFSSSNGLAGRRGDVVFSKIYSRAGEGQLCGPVVETCPQGRSLPSTVAIGQV